MAGDTPGTVHEDQAHAGAPRAAAPLALYRRYRPATFAEVKGQEHVTEPLRQALRNGRVHHAYLFSGPRGCGKTSSARILARSLNCVQGPTPDPCGVCDSCVALAPAGPGSIDVIEIDAASHGGVDDARDLREKAFYAPVSGRFKIYIIDEAHMVTREGFNALLKLVEEPPPHLKFVFATTEPEKVIATIRSRTHHYPFRLVPPGVLRELLEEILAAEGVTYQPSVLPLVVRAGAGSVRDSLSVLDQLIAGAGAEGLVYEQTVALLGYSDDTLLDAMVDAFATGDGGAAFGAIDQAVHGGHDPRRFAADLLDRLRDLIILVAVPGAGKAGLLDAPADRLERMAGQAERFGQAELARAAELLSDGLIQMRGTASPRLLLELMCAQVLLPGAGTGERALLVRLERLERRLDGAAGAGPGAAPAGTSAPARGSSGGQAQRDPADAAPPARPGPAASSRASAGETTGRAQADSSPGAAGQAGRSRGGGAQAGSAHAESGRAESGRARADQGGGQADTGRSEARPQQSAPAQQPPPRPVVAGGPVDMDVVRERWPNVLDAVRTERRLAWIQLGSATVQSLEGGVLTVGFASEGMAKGFSASGCDQVLAGALNSVLGVNVRVKAVVAAEAAVPSARASSVATGTPHVTPGRSPAAAEPARESPAGPPSAGSPSAGSPGQGPQGQGPQGHSDAAPPAAGEGSRRGAAPGEDAPQAGGQVSEPRAEEPGQQPAPGGQGAASAGGGAKEEAVRAATSGRRAARRPAAASGGGNAAKQARSRQPSESQGGAGYADEEWPDDAGGPGNAGAGPDALTGMELIQRQLGGRVIEEIDEA